MKLSVNALKIYYEKVLDTKSKYRGSGKRKMFCKINKNKLRDFDFHEIYETILEHYDDMREYMDQ